MKVRELMQPHVTVVREEDTLSFARQLMTWNVFRHLPVVPDRGEPVTGVITERDIFRACQDSPGQSSALLRPVCDFMSTPPLQIHPDAGIAEAAADLVSNKVGCLVVTEEDRLVGLLSVTDLLRALTRVSIEEGGTARRPAGPTVASIMYPEPISVRAEDSLLTLASAMAVGGRRQACVVDEAGRVIGIISERDIRRVMGDPRSFAAYETFALPLQQQSPRVEQAMTPEPCVVHLDDPIEAALPRLLREGVDALPVVDSDHRLRGIVSYVDVLRHCETTKG